MSTGSPEQYAPSDQARPATNVGRAGRSASGARVETDAVVRVGQVMVRARRAKSIAIRLARFTSTCGSSRATCTDRPSSRAAHVDGELLDVDVAELAAVDPGLHDPGDQVAPLLVELATVVRDSRMLERLAPELEPQPPGAGELLLGLGVERHVDQLREPLVDRAGLVQQLLGRPGRTPPRSAAARRSAARPWSRSSR